MIKFFRKIRQNLLIENKTGKYFKYAVGEIILVVIGILIALQVNNLNEQRKENNFEVDILKQIRTNLQTDLLEIREDLEVIDLVNKACLDVRNHLLNLDQPSDSLSISTAILRVTPHFRPITIGYNILQNRSVGIIKNDSLRDAILYQYDMLYPYYKTYEDERGRFHALHSEPQLLEYFSMNYDVNQLLSFTGLFFEISEEDYQRLRNDLKFLKLLKAIAFENSVIQSRGKRVEKSTLGLINKINVELNSK
jgi:hypothetical protein